MPSRVSSCDDEQRHARRRCGRRPSTAASGATGRPARAVPVGRDATPGGGSSPGAGREQADDGFGVAHVDGQAARSALLEVETEIEDGGRMGDRPDRDQVGPGRRVERRAVEGDTARHLDQDTGSVGPGPHGAARTTPPRRVSCCRGGRRRLRRRGPRPPGRRGHTPPPPSDRATTARARATASAMLRPPRWLSFTSTASDRLPRWLWAPPARTAAFSSARRPGVVLRVSRTRVAGLAARDGVDVPPGGGGHPRQVTQEVERGPLRGEDRAQRAAHGADDRAGHHRGAVVEHPVDRHRRVDLGERLQRAQTAGHHPRTAGHDVGRRRGGGGDERGGEVSEGQDVFG